MLRISVNILILPLNSGRQETHRQTNLGVYSRISGYIRRPGYGTAELHILLYVTTTTAGADTTADSFDWLICVTILLYCITAVSDL